MRINIASIRIRKRIRKDSGNIQSLMDSIAKHGIIQPVLIDQNYNLIAGYRRLLAAKNLGYQTIETRIISITNDIDFLKLEIEENMHRLDFTPEELLTAQKRLAELHKPQNIFLRFWRALRDWLRNIFSRRK